MCLKGLLGFFKTVNTYWYWCKHQRYDTILILNTTIRFLTTPLNLLQYYRISFLNAIIRYLTIALTLRRYDTVSVSDLRANHLARLFRHPFKNMNSEMKFMTVTSVHLNLCLLYGSKIVWTLLHTGHCIRHLTLVRYNSVPIHRAWWLTE